MITSIGKVYLSKNSCNQSNSCLACSQLSSKVKNFFLSSSQICLIFICIFFSPHGENKYLSDRLCYQSFSRLEIKEVFFFFVTIVMERKLYTTCLILGVLN